MSDEIVRNIIETRLQDNWVLTEIDYDGVRYVPRKGVSFISPMISEVPARQKGFKCISRTYTLLVEVRVPKNTGTATINSYCDALKTLLEGYEEGNFYCMAGEAARVGNSKQWYQKNVTFVCKYKSIG